MEKKVNGTVGKRKAKVIRLMQYKDEFNILSKVSKTVKKNTPDIQ